MRLRLFFSGMQLFVPQTTPGSGRVQVVMPRSTLHHGTARHIPLLVVNASHLAPGNQVLSDGWLIYPLRGWVLPVNGTVLDTRICPEIVNLRDVTQLDVDSDVLGANENGRAVARVDLFAGRMSRVERGVCWYWQSSTPRRVANSAEWEVNLAGENVLLKLKKWTGTEEVELPTMYPLEGGDVVDVKILNLPPTDLPPEPEEVHKPPEWSEAPHFGDYYSLLDGFGPEGHPRFAKDECDPFPGACPPITWEGGSPYNCMLATINPPWGG